MFYLNLVKIILDVLMKIVFFYLIGGRCKEFKFYFNKVLMCMNLLLK